MNNIGTDVYDSFVPTHPLDLQGWVGNQTIFEKLIDQQKPNVIIEVGTWKGKSAIMMANVVKRLNLNCKIYCVDTWLGAIEFWDWLSHTPERNLHLKHGYPQVYYQFLSNVVHTNNQDVIIPVPLPSNLGCKLLKRKNIQSQLIYIDASHETDDVYDDMKHYYELLSPGGIMFGDDYSWESVRNGVSKFVSDRNYQSQLSNDGHLNWILKKPL